MTDMEKYAKQAKEMGAQDAVPIEIEDIVMDYRTLMKCMYGCGGWNNEWTCPSDPWALKPWEFERILPKYGKGLLIHCTDKKLSQKISWEIERQAFLDGHYFAFSMSDCSLCPECAHPEPCKNHKKARPAMQALGIDVFATARKQGLPIDTLKSREDQQNWYSLVLV